MQFSELNRTRFILRPHVEDPYVFIKLHDSCVRIPAVSVGDENGPVGSDGDGGRAIESVLAVAGDSRLAQRQQNLPVRTEFENLLALAVFALAVSAPPVSVLLHTEPVRHNK